MKITTLQVKTFRVDENPADGVFVKATGRPTGFFGWLLSGLGLGTESTLKVTAQDISFKTASLSGEFNQVIPLRKVASTHCGYAKPIILLVIAAVVVLASLYGFSLTDNYGKHNWAVLIVGLVIAVLFVIAYAFTKKVIMAFETTGGMVLGLAFRGIDVQHAIEAVELVNELVNKKVREI